MRAMKVKDLVVEEGTFQRKHGEKWLDGDYQWIFWNVN